MPEEDLLPLISVRAIWTDTPKQGPAARIWCPQASALPTQNTIKNAPATRSLSLMPQLVKATDSPPGNLATASMKPASVMLNLSLTAATANLLRL